MGSGFFACVSYVFLRSGDRPGGSGTWLIELPPIFVLCTVCAKRDDYYIHDMLSSPNFRSLHTDVFVYIYIYIYVLPRPHQNAPF